MTETPPAVESKNSPSPVEAKTAGVGRREPLLWLALVAVAGLAAWPLVKPKPADDARVAALEARIDALPKPATEVMAAKLDEQATNSRALAERLAKLESTGASKDALGRIEESQDALASQTKTMSESVARNAAETERAIRRLDETLDRLERRLTVAEARLEAGTGAPAALALGFGQLRQALSRSGPFADELERFKTLARDDTAIRAAAEALGARARQGAASFDELRGRFVDVARNAARHTAKGTDGLWGEIVDRLASLVVIRRVGEVAGDTAEALVARAEARLADGDLAAAVALVERLSGEAAKAAAQWLADARARLDVERALGDVEARVAERIGKAAGRP